MNMVRNNINFIERRRGRARTDAWSRSPGSNRMAPQTDARLRLPALLLHRGTARSDHSERRNGPTYGIRHRLLPHLPHHLVLHGETGHCRRKFDAWPGMWISTLVLLPIGVLLTWKAATDSPLFDADAYYRGWERISLPLQASACAYSNCAINRPSRRSMAVARPCTTLHAGLLNAGHEVKVLCISTSKHALNMDALPKEYRGTHQDRRRFRGYIM